MLTENTNKHSLYYWTGSKCLFVAMFCASLGFFLMSVKGPQTVWFLAFAVTFLIFLSAAHISIQDKQPAYFSPVSPVIFAVIAHGGLIIATFLLKPPPPIIEPSKPFPAVLRRIERERNSTHLNFVSESGPMRLSILYSQVMHPSHLTEGNKYRIEVWKNFLVSYEGESANEKLPREVFIKDMGGPNYLGEVMIFFICVVHLLFLAFAHEKAVEGKESRRAKKKRQRAERCAT